MKGKVGGTLSGCIVLFKAAWLKCTRVLKQLYEGKIGPPHERFKQARERAGLSVDEVAARMGMPWNAVWDIETDPTELTMSFSPNTAVLQGPRHSAGSTLLHLTNAV
jgi:hypothetical protein